MIRFQSNPDRTLSAMPLRRQHQRPLDAGGSGGRRIVKRLINTARSPEDSPQVVNLHEPDSCKGPAAQPDYQHRHAKKPERKGQRRTVTH